MLENVHKIIVAYSTCPFFYYQLSEVYVDRRLCALITRDKSAVWLSLYKLFIRVDVMHGGQGNVQPHSQSCSASSLWSLQYVNIEGEGWGDAVTCRDVRWYQGDKNAPHRLTLRAGTQHAETSLNGHLPPCLQVHLTRPIEVLLVQYLRKLPNADTLLFRKADRFLGPFSTWYAWY